MNRARSFCFACGIGLLAAGFPILGKSAAERSKDWKPPAGSAPAAEFDWNNRLVSIRGGTFRMGSREGRDDAAPRDVTVGDFDLGRFEVTVDEFAEYLNSTAATQCPSPQLALRSGRWAARWRQGNRPAAFVSAVDAEAYCRWLSARSGRTVRLPTEAEWEYAARGGIPRARYPWGWGDPAGRAQFNATSSAAVGSFDPNPFGLYDMAGNVFEWCVRSGDGSAGRWPARGGSWAERDPKLLRVFERTWFAADYRDADAGFRILVEPRSGQSL